MRTRRTRSKLPAARVAITVSDTNAPPTVTISAPANGANFSSAPASFALSATANAGEVNGWVAKVEFYVNGNLVNTDTAGPWSSNVSGLANGNYTLTAKATDQLGAETTSAPVTVTVGPMPALHFIEVDHLNTPRAIYDQNDQLKWRWDQAEPFGVNAPDENPSSLGAFEFPVRFPGQYADKETNLSYNYFRDYDPTLGRYPQSDPIGLRGGFNTYSYVDLAPLVGRDFFGLICSFVDIGTPICKPTNMLREKPGATTWHTELETRVVFDPTVFPSPNKRRVALPLPGWALEWRTVLVKIGQMERLYNCTVWGAFRCWNDCTKKLESEVFGPRQYTEWQFDKNFVDRDPYAWHQGNIPDPSNLPPLPGRR